MEPRVDVFCHILPKKYDAARWERVEKTRRFLRNREDTGEIPAAALRAAWDELYAAEGSDWFWWYGADQTSAGNADDQFTWGQSTWLPVAGDLGLGG